MTTASITHDTLATGPFDGVAEMARRHPVRVGVLLLALAGLLTRVGYVLITPHFVPISDASRYFYRGLYLYQHHHLPPPLWGRPTAKAPDAYWPPFYAMFLATVDEFQHLMGFLEIDRVEMIRLVQAVLGAGSVALIALIALRLFARRVAIAAAAIFAVYPPMIYVGASLYSESLWLPLFLAAVAALAEYVHRPRTSMLVAAGLLTAVGTLTHSDGLYLLVAAVIVLLVRRGTRKRRVRDVGVYLVVAALTIAPWTIRNEVKFHAFVPISTSLGNTLLGTYNATSAHNRAEPDVWTNPPKIPALKHLVVAHNNNEVRQDSVDTQYALHYIEHYPTYPFAVAFWNTLRLFELRGLGWAAYVAHWESIPARASDLGVYAFWLVGLLALAGCFTGIVRRGPKWVWTIPVIMFLGTVFIQSEAPRFRMPIDPFLIVLAAAALVSIWDRIEPWRRPGVRAEYANT